MYIPPAAVFFFSKQLDEVQHEIEMDILQPYCPKSCVISPGGGYTRPNKRSADFVRAMGKKIQISM